MCMDPITRNPKKYVGDITRHWGNALRFYLPPFSIQLYLEKEENFHEKVLYITRRTSLGRLPSLIVFVCGSLQAYCLRMAKNLKPALQ